MGAAALGETLLSTTRQTTAGEQGLLGAIARHRRFGALAFVAIAIMLGSAAGGAALGAGWATSVFTTVALGCAAASIATRRLGRQGRQGRQQTA